MERNDHNRKNLKPDDPGIKTHEELSHINLKVDILKVLIITNYKTFNLIPLSSNNRLIVQVSCVFVIIF